MGTRTTSTCPRSSGSGGGWSVSLPGGARVLAATSAAGDFADPLSASAEAAAERLVGVPWTWLRQVHGAKVVVVDRPGGRCGEEADAAVTTCPQAALLVRTADCAPVALASPEGVVAIVHAGWRGLVAGVVEAALAVMGRLGATSVFAAVGPCIKAHAYPFSPADLEQVAARFGASVVSSDALGRPALDLPAAVGRALEAAGARVAAKSGACTHCSGEHWSWRARGDRGRQATFVWKAP